MRCLWVTTCAIKLLNVLLDKKRPVFLFTQKTIFLLKTKTCLLILMNKREDTFLAEHDDMSPLLNKKTRAAGAVTTKAELCLSKDVGK